MKWTKNILFLLVLFVFSVVELSAQARSSASQVVTFGVQRSGVQTFGLSTSSNAVTQSPLKVTIGSEWNLQDAAEPMAIPSQQKFVSGKFSESTGKRSLQSANPLKEPSMADSEPLATKSMPKGKLLVTLTE